jgi:hypothetical protein
VTARPINTRSRGRKRTRVSMTYYSGLDQFGVHSAIIPKTVPVRSRGNCSILELFFLA